MDKHIRIIFAIDTPNPAVALIGHDQAAYGYNEPMPTHILTLDTELNHLAEAEVRRVVEENPTGSLRGFARRPTTVEHNFGSTIVYDTTVVIDYHRDLT